MSILKTFKQCLSLVFAAAFVIGCMVITPIVNDIEASASSGYYTWSGYSTYLKGVGSEANPFLISSPNDLAYFRKQVALSTGTITYYDNNDTTTTAKTKDADSCYYRLTCDIYYNDPNGEEWKTWSSSVAPTNGGGSAHTWTPPGYADESNRRFEGGFDGAGYTIYGMYIVHTDSNCVGFIGTARYATIENLTLARGYVEGANLVGGFLGQSKVGVDVVNCTSDLRVKGKSGVGGFIGGNAVNGSSLSVDADVTNEPTVPSFAAYGCVNNSTVSGTSYAGGIVGYISAGASRAQFEKCENNATISAAQSCAGGIVGGTRLVDGYGHNVIQSCINNGTVKGSTGSTTADTYNYTGGIVGCGRATEIYSCINNGTVKSVGKYVAGISGGNNTADPHANGRIFYSYNTGTITGSSYTGGIVGVGKSMNINMCGNVGNVTGTAYVGGISGRSSGVTDKRDSELYDCYNTGTVTSSNGSASVAGIIGDVYCEGTVDDNKYVKVKRCINLGSVSSGRAICYTSSTLKNSAGTGLFAYTNYNTTCFGVSGVNTNFDGGTAVSSLALPEVLSTLNAASADTWRAGYPFPTLNKIPYSLQNYNGRANMFASAAITVNDGPVLSARVSVNTSGSYYGTVSANAISYGVLVAKEEALGDAELTADHPSAQSYIGSFSDNSFTAVISGQSVDEYDDMLVVRPYASFTANGQTVYVYGATAETSYYTADGGKNVSAVNETAAFTCQEKIYVLVGGTNKIEYSFDSASREDSVSFVSSDPSVATVSKGKVTGVSEGITSVAVTFTGDWGSKTLHCQVNVLADLTEGVFANQYAEQDGKFRLHTNELQQIATSITKNDGSVIDYNGTVIMIDGGNNNSKSLEYLLELREEFLADGLASGALTEPQYYRLKLSKKCQIQLISFITHWHSDHIHALRYVISKSPYVNIKKMYTTKDPTGTTAKGYTNYINAFDSMVSNLLTYSPDLVPTQLAFETRKMRYFNSCNALSTTDTSYPISVTMCTPKDWSTQSSINGNQTNWNNCSSTWYLIEYAGVKLLFTGDSYATNVGTTYTANKTSGSTGVDHMLSLHKSVINTDIDFLDCNHHGRGAFVPNLFTETQPSIVFAGVYFGQEDVDLASLAVKTADVYLGGDGGHVFVIDSTGTINTDGAKAAYYKNASGHAIRNHITMHYNVDLPVVKPAVEKIAATGITLSASSLTVLNGRTKALTATVLGEDATDKTVVWTVSDPTVLYTDGANVSALKAGTVTVTASSGGYSATCSVTVLNLLGDVNVDGVVSVSDLLILENVVRGTADLTDLVLTGGDMNYDEVIGGLDVIMVENVILGKQ